MTNANTNVRKSSGIGLLLLVNLLAITCISSPGTGDVSIWETWMSKIDNDGLVNAFAHTIGTDYPPLAIVILWAVVRVAQTFGTTQFLILKCSLLLFLLITSGGFYWFSRNFVLTAAFELSLILSSVALSYLDIYFAPFLIAALFLIRHGRFSLGFLFYAVSCFIKWQPLIIAPFVCVYIFAAAGDAAADGAKMKRRLAPFALSAVALVLPILAIFGVPAVFESFKRAATFHKFLSGYALNLGWIETWALHLLAPEKYGPLQNGTIDAVLVSDWLIIWPNKILFYLSYAAILFAFARQRQTFGRLIVYSMLGYLAYFSFNTGVHENHLFLICCFAWVLVFVEPAQFARCLNLSLAANANLFLFFGAFGQRLNPVFAGFDITLVFAVANLCLFAGFLLRTFRTDGVNLRFWKSQRG